MKDKTIFLCFGWLLICGLFGLTHFASAQSKDLRTLRDDKQSDGYVGVALVIGNSAYRHATKLNSPVNDAADMAKTLDSLGFKILKVRADATLEEMDDAVAEFGRALAANKGVGIFYYSGHGVQSYGKNYLIPVDANIPLETFLKSRSLDTDVVLQTMATSTKGFKIVILDACRNNPFAKSWGYKGGDIGGGLAGIYSAPRGMIIAYATSPNDTAADGRKRNSPYTEVLLQEMVKPGVRIGEMFGDVRDILDKQTDGDQTPWESTSLVGRFCFAGCNLSNSTAATNSNSQTANRNEPDTSTVTDDVELDYFKDEAGKYGYKNKENDSIVVAPKYDDAWSFYDKLAKVKLNDKYGYINKRGIVVIPLKYDAAADFTDGLASVGLNGKYGFINAEGKEVIPFKYDEGKSFTEGLAAVKLEGKWGFIDRMNKEIIPLKYDDVFGFNDGWANVELNGKQGFINKDNEIMIPFKYDWTWYRFYENFLQVKLNGKYGFVDKAGKVVIPIEYDYTEIYFCEGLMLVKLNGKYGYVDKANKIVIPIKYDDANSFNDDRAKVKLGDREFYIDKNGNEIAPE